MTAQDRFTSFLVFLSFIIACGDPAIEPEAVPSRPVAIAITPASTTLTYVGETTVFTATVTDQFGGHFPATITWTSDADSVFSVNSAGVVAAVSNGSGIVTASFQALSATADVTVVQTPTNAVVVSGGEQDGLPGSTLRHPVVVRVADRGGAPVPATAVRFMPAEGHGSAYPDSADTDSAGEVATLWTLGSILGPQILTASLAGVVRVRVTATSTLGSAINLLSGGRQRALPGVALQDPIVVRVLDTKGRPLPGARVLFVPNSGHGSVTADSVITDDAGEAAVIWTLGDTVGTQRLDVGISSGLGIQVTATALSGIGVCDRTLQVQHALLRATGQQDCADVTATLLAKVRSLRVYGVPHLYYDDFSGLAALDSLYLNDNDFWTLPASVFSDLRSLRYLRLVRNPSLIELPSNLLDGLSNLTHVMMTGAGLETLPESLFRDLHGLETLSISDNPIRELPSSLFTGLSKLRALHIVGRYDDPTAVPQHFGVHDSVTAPLSPFTPLEFAERQAGTFDSTLQRNRPSLASRHGHYGLLGDPLPVNLLSGLSSLERVSLGGWFAAIPQRAFTDLVALKSLTLSGPITDIAEGAFAGLDALHSLTIGAQLRAFPTQALSDLSGLDTLRFWSPLTNIDADAFVGLPSLQSLSLGGSDIRELPGGIFSRLGQLKFLNLSDHDHLTTIEPDALSGLVNMEYIQLFGTAVSSLPVGVFADLQKMRYLWLDNNALTNVPDGVFTSLRNLEQLALGEPMVRLSQEAFEDLPKLSFLWLYATRLTNLPLGVFSDLTSLKTLRLERYQRLAPIMFSEESFSGLASLRALRIFNMAGEIPTGLFGGLAELSTLDLLENSIRELPSSTFVGLRELQRLTLCRNPGADFPVRLELERTDAADLTAPGPATMIVRLPLGAPFDMDVEMAAYGATLSSSTATITKGSAASEQVVVTKNADHSGKVWVRFAADPAIPAVSCRLRQRADSNYPYVGLEMVLGDSMAIFD